MTSLKLPQWSSPIGAAKIQAFNLLVYTQETFRLGKYNRKLCDKIRGEQKGGPQLNYPNSNFSTIHARHIKLSE